MFKRCEICLHVRENRNASDQGTKKIDVFPISGLCADYCGEPTTYLLKLKEIRISIENRNEYTIMGIRDFNKNVKI